MPYDFEYNPNVKTNFSQDEINEMLQISRYRASETTVRPRLDSIEKLNLHIE